MDTNQSPEDLIDDIELSAWVKCAPSSPRKWRVLGTGPKFKKVGHLVRYRRGDVQAWLDGNTFSSTTRRTESATA